MSTKVEAKEASRTLTERLRIFDLNYSRTTGNKSSPRKRSAGATTSLSNIKIVLELQSLRWGVLALVEVGKLVGFHYYYSI